MAVLCPNSAPAPCIVSAPCRWQQFDHTLLKPQGFAMKNRSYGPPTAQKVNQWIAVLVDEWWSEEKKQTKAKRARRKTLCNTAKSK